MLAYIARRLIWVVFLLFFVLLITFVIFSVLPAGDPAVQRAGRQPSPELVETIRAQLGLDNVADAAVFDQCGLPQPGRTLRLAIELR